MPLKRGFVHVYTGNGKGKTSAALGLCLRALGRGLSCCFIQFLKGKPTGEIEAVKKLPNFHFIQTGRPDYDFCVTEVDKELALRGFQLAEEAIEKFDILVLDEINIVVHLGLIPLSRVIDLIDRKPPRVELILTGRHAKAEIIKRADYVTEFCLVKHPFYRGENAREGIDF
ncbi:cob(I)yrinic acid a,c-diamide adenosyltransferase [Phorcysia thermohydrogeniphila]|uniref:corrinoid adenosyltransferase n=1 Tax=Phorcysia thermohydrogeniphila TaxID=936138 RepID=A0A4R1GHQ4_9BACT|nr:cob(I)yrinic acid a,c-diamide adenosyltransferase [Phorcysia thermohydrogeniphila]TCK06550.1 cob(I)alamin adenosyltransferase [Phorcysia thermohydrogeniphila]